MKRIFSQTVFVFFVMIFSISLQAQQMITLGQCYEKARANYPLIKQQNLLDISAEYTLDNISKGYLPQISVNGQYTTQSDVTSLPIKIPGVSVPSLSTEQYKAYVEIQQGITGNYVVAKQKEVAQANAEIEKQKLEVELYKLHERIQDLYFGILLVNSQLDLIALSKKDIQTGIEKVNAAVANGIAFKSSADILQAELISIEQRETELQFKKYGLILMLNSFTKFEITDSTVFIAPKYPEIIKKITRPELSVFDKQMQMFDAQSKLITSQNIPKLGLFFQTGYGNPAINMFSNSLDYYYIGGIRFTWNLGGLYTYSKDQDLLQIQKDMVGVQKDVFVFNTILAATQKNADVQMYEKLFQSDNQIISLRKKVVENAKVQLENGAITTIDYINYVNARDKAAQNLAIHDIQYLQELYKLSNYMGE